MYIVRCYLYRVKGEREREHCLLCCHDRACCRELIKSRELCAVVYAQLVYLLGCICPRDKSSGVVAMRATCAAARRALPTCRPQDNSGSVAVIRGEPLV